MDWNHLFANHILNRGYKYFNDGSVENLAIENGCLTATVYGTDHYEVEITFNGDAITDMYCTCPYAESGDNCKHMAAVLYEWGADLQVDKESKQKNHIVSSERMIKKVSIDTRSIDEEEVNTVVARADEATVKSFLAAILRDDAKLYARFKTIVSPTTSKEDMKRYLKHVDAVVRKYLGREQYINYREVEHFISEMEEFLNEDVQNMLNHESYLNAFELTNYIFITSSNVDMDDYDGGLAMLASCCRYIWIKILENADDQVRRTMFNWFIAHLNGSVIDYMEDSIEQVLMKQFNTHEYREAKLSFFEQKIKSAKNNSDSRSQSYQVSRWVLKNISLMRDLGKSWFEIEKYCKENWKYDAVRTYYINECIDQQNYETAIHVLKESLQLDADYVGLVRNYSMMLKDVYYICGKKEDYLHQLWQLMIKDDAGNIEIYSELKANYTEQQWVQVRETIFAQLPARAHVDRLYKMEGLYDRLLSYVLKSSGLYELEEYVDVLKEKYPVEILQKYADEVNKMAAHTADRKHYKQLVSILRKMRKIDNGTEMVNGIVLNWKMIYRNRPAMMDELSKLK